MPLSPRTSLRAAEERVVLVDANDVELGTLGKLEAHAAGALHRALSVFVFNARGELLMQRRAATKYHSPGLWSNTCCGHPRPGEATLAAAHRRLREEMGIDCPLVPAFAFTYRADLGGGLSEHEFDHVLVGRWDGEPAPHPAEVAEWRWAALPALHRELARDTSGFTAWFARALDGLVARGLQPSR